MRLLGRLLGLFVPKPKAKRLDLRFVSWSEADRMIRENPSWRVAKEEDRNRLLGWVFIERVETVQPIQWTEMRNPWPPAPPRPAQPQPGRR
jgi:hypothetical protein